MKRSNWIVLAILVLISAFLLWLWYYLGFNKVDNPFDLVLSIIWWIGVAVIVWLVYRSEKKRQEQIRTIYVSPTSLFNSERGVVECPDPAQRVTLMEDILGNLRYNFHREDMPSKDEFDFRYVVRTEDYKEPDKDEESQQKDAIPTATQVMTDVTAPKEQEDEPTWKGTVVKIDHVQGNVENDFDDRQGLCAALA